MEQKSVPFYRQTPTSASGDRRARSRRRAEERWPSPQRRTRAARGGETSSCAGESSEGVVLVRDVKLEGGRQRHPSGGVSAKEMVIGLEGVELGADGKVRERTGKQNLWCSYAWKHNVTENALTPIDVGTDVRSSCCTISTKKTNIKSCCCFSFRCQLMT